MKKTTLVRSEQTRKIKQIKPMNKRKKAKLALKAGVARPAEFPGWPIDWAATVGSVT